MIKQGHLGTLELFCVFTMYQTILTIYNLGAELARRAATGAWLLHIVADLGGLILFIPIYLLLKRFPDQSIIDIASEVLGRAGRILVTVLIGGLYLYYLVIFIRVAAEAVAVEVLPTTPISIIMGIGILGPLIIAYLGLENLGRTALIFAPFILFGYFLIIVLSIPDKGVEGLFPILGISPFEHLTNALQLSPIVHETMFLGIWAPYFRKGKSMVKFVIWGFVVSTLVGTAVVAVLQVVFPYPLLEFIPLPVYQAVKMIYFGRFIQRVEALYVVMSIVMSSLHAATILLNGILAVAQGLRLDDWRPIIFPWGVIAFAVAMATPPATQLSAWFYQLPNAILYASVTIAIPALLYLVAVARGKKGGERLEPQTN